MIQQTQNGFSVEGSVTFSNAASVLEEGKQQFGKDNLTIDLKPLKELDSSALAVIFEWVRHAKEQHVNIKFINIPANLKSLAALYGVVELIPT